MNKDVPDDDASIVYYDGDYPSLEIGEARAEHAATLARLGMLGDVPFYKERAAETGGPVLEIGCGTGRLTIPLARAGHEVWAVDVSTAMLDQLRAKLAREAPEVQARVHPVRQDATMLDLPVRDCRLAVIPFNVLMLIPELAAERRTLAAAAAHLAPGGTLALDVMNPLTLPMDAETKPSPSEPRRSPHNGNSYIRNTMASRLDEGQCQRIHGWYDELLPDGKIAVTEYGFTWRMIFRYELELMLESAGFTIERLAGDFEDAPWTVDSRRMVVTARRASPVTKE
ncbi:class I SAM-dependent methyltransferase [Azospirillum brasilense]|uniref:class I SAM-dependent methyltransferase n=1 Tax=Azospirillum brasilense TaxID=192 RepID=UPI000E6A21FF|nr:class I SAM-dependent methyltransferase [Azospirillum brasilense]NUB26998.1 methyltransferase domain-containing protein [Azospirillum brasilense]NUB34740.1 methyltransferase domain-containing protein [Azospirillum brasilense]RIV97887.1 class I SAM-dependent methyltransferase [Azospirillum brasilense]